MNNAIVARIGNFLEADFENRTRRNQLKQSHSLQVFGHFVRHPRKILNNLLQYNVTDTAGRWSTNAADVLSTIDFNSFFFGELDTIVDRL